MILKTIHDSYQHTPFTLTFGYIYSRNYALEGKEKALEDFLIENSELKMYYSTLSLIQANIKIVLSERRQLLPSLALLISSY